MRLGPHQQNTPLQYVFVCVQVFVCDRSSFPSPCQWGQSLRLQGAGVWVCVVTKRDLRNSAMFWSHGRFDKSVSKQGQKGWGDPTVMTAVYRCHDLTVLTSFQPQSVVLVCGLRWHYKGSVSISLSNILTDLFHAFWHLDGRRPVKLVSSPGLKFKLESQTHLSKTVCGYSRLNFDSKNQVYSHFVHTSGTAMPSHGCTSIHPVCGLNGEEKWKQTSHNVSKIL